MKTEGFVLVKNGASKEAFNLQEITLNSLESDEVLIASEAFGLNYADVMARRGLYREAPPLPCVVGYEVVGTILEVGSSVSKEWIGQRVVGFTRFGGYAKHAITKVDAIVEIGSIKASEALSLATQGVTAYYMSELVSPIRKNDHVLIHAAAGGVGSLLIQLAKNRGAIVYAKVGNQSKVEHCKRLGADFVVDYSQSDYESKMVELLAGKLLDVSYNPVAGSTFKKDLKLIKTTGKVVLFGGSELSGSKWGILSQLNFVRKMGFFTPIVLMMKSLSIIGVNMLKVADNRPDVLKDCLENVFELYQQGKLKAVSGGEFTAEEFCKAHDLLESGKSTGKLIVKW